MAKFSVGEKVDGLKTMVRTDTTTNRVKDYVVKGAPQLPAASAQYLLDKVPIVSWLPRYHPSWLLTDAIAGLTIGVMLIPQGLAYAKIATIPIENGLYSSWIPAAICVFMGTSKGKSLHSLEEVSSRADNHQLRSLKWTNFHLRSADCRNHRRPQGRIRRCEDCQCCFLHGRCLLSCDGCPRPRIPLGLRFRSSSHWLHLCHCLDHRIWSSRQLSRAQ